LDPTTAEILSLVGLDVGGGTADDFVEATGTTAAGLEEMASGVTGLAEGLLEEVMT
jgi:hypothetical protein